MLLGNVLRWEEGYLGRQHPVLPAAPGFVRKVKPLYRLGEREMAAYCVLRGIDYQVEECPMAAGNRHLGYKELLNDLELRSPGSKAAFLFGFVERGHARFAADAGRGARRARDVRGVRGTDARRPLRVLPPQGAGRKRPTGAGAPDEGGRGARREERPVSRPLTVGERVLLVDSKQRRHLITLAEGGEFHSHTGVLRHDDLIGHDEGISVRTTMGARLLAVRPTLGEYVLEMPRGAQVIYPKDLGPILLLADIFPGARVLESGVGSGALTMTLLRAVGPAGSVVGYELPRRLRRRARSATSRACSATTCRSGSRYATCTTASTKTISTGSSSTSPSPGAS